MNVRAAAVGKGIAWLACAAALFLGGAAARAEKTGEVLTASGVRYPSYNEKGEMTSQMFGETARVLPNGYVEVTSLRMEFYAGDETNRHTDMTVTTPRCIYHREHGAAISDSDVRIAKDNMVVTGKGFYWDQNSQLLKIASQTKVVLRNVSRQVKKGSKP